jgi:uncharacterized membrane protein
MKQEWRQSKDDIAARLNRLQAHFDSFEALIVSRRSERRQSTPSEAAAPQVESPTPALPTNIPPPIDSPQKDAQEEAPPPQPPPPPAWPPHDTSTSPIGRATEVQFGQKWLLIGGIAITVFGLGFFLKYAFEQNWVGPAGRVVLSYLASATFLGVGDHFRRKGAKIFGLYLLGGGIAALYLTTFAASQIYDLIGPIPAFGFMMLVTLLAGTLSLLYDTKWLSVLGLIGGFLTPILLSTGRDNQLALMSYMTLLNAGILAIAAFKQWTVLNYLGFGFTWLLFSGWYASFYEVEKFWRTTFFLNLFFLIYAVVPFLYYFVRERQERVKSFAILSPNAFIAFGFSYAMIREYAALPFVSIVTLAYAGLFFWMAHYLYQRNRENRDPLVLLLSQGIFFLLITVPILFSGHWITIFWAAQTIALLWAAVHLQHRWLYRGAAMVLILTVGKFVLHDYDEIFRLRLLDLYYARGFTHLVVERWLTTTTVLATLLTAAHMLRTASANILPSWLAKGESQLLRTFGMLLFFALNCEVGAFFYDYAPQARFAAISVLWTLFAAALMGLGFTRELAGLRQTALGFFAVTVVKVFFWDMAKVSTPFRIISFIVLGLMLIGASYLYHRYRERLGADTTEEEQVS